MEKVRHPEISVIVPVYNVEPYLRCCLDSILAQTFTNFELILVDDGSTDKSGDICDEYALNDERITVIHQKNSGASVARNSGLAWVYTKSECEWITFVDSDDYIHPRYLEFLYHSVLSEDAEIALTNCWRFENDKELILNDMLADDRMNMSGREVCYKMYDINRLTLPSAWGKIYNRKIFREIRFPVGRIFEDESIIPIIIYQAEKVCILKANLYYYRQRAGSVMNAHFTKRRLEFMDAFDDCILFYERNNDKCLVKHATVYKRGWWANYVAKAWLNGIYYELPEKHKMPIWKAYWILTVESLKRGGIKVVFQRISNMLHQVCNKIKK